MSDTTTKAQNACIALEYDIDEPPQKVWRAITIAEFRDTWLPKEALADPEATSLSPGEEVSYRMRENAPPFLESVVTFQISPNTTGGTRLRIIHELMGMNFRPMTTAAANDDATPVRLAA